VRCGIWQHRSTSAIPAHCARRNRSLQCTDVALPTAAHGETRLRRIIEPDAALAAILDRFDIILPKRRRPKELDRLQLCA